MIASPPTQIQRLYISPGHNYFGHHGKPSGESPIIECTEVRCVAGRGLEGDRFFDYKSDYKGQVTFFASEVYDRMCADFGISDRPVSVFRRNIITAGLDLPAMIGQEFEIQGVRFLGTSESAPCYWMEQAFASGAEEWLKGNGGLRAKVLCDGILRVG